MSEYKKIDSYRSISDAEKLYNQRIEDSLTIYNKYNKEFIIRKCYICGSDNYTNLEKFHEKYRIVKCDICGNIFVNPCPSEQALEDYYENCFSNNLLDQFYKKRNGRKDDFVLNDRINMVLNLIDKKEKDKLSILEVGCGSGSFLTKLKVAIKERGIKKEIALDGIDIDENVIKNNLDDELNLICSSVENFFLNSKKKYDIVINFELIEHLLDPFNFLKEINNNILEDEGYLFFTVPNLNSLDNKCLDYNSFRLLAHSIFPPMHINSFTNENILHFCIRSGFKIIEIKSQGRLDVDLISRSSHLLDDNIVKEIAEMDESAKIILQHSLNIVNGTGNMRCVLMKNK